jgi:peptidyl-prolyl cis-trans isomerase D
LAREYSDGPTKTRGGDLGFFQEGEMTEAFFDFCNNAAIDRVGVVETEFGFHVIKVTDKNDLALIADVTAAIVPSDKTSNEIFRNATQFEMEAKETKDFLGTAEKSGYSVQPVNTIAVLEENMPGLYQQRNIVKWAFEGDTKLGDVRRFTLSDGSYAVVQLTAIQEQGLAPVEDVEEEIREILIEEKKANLIIDQFQQVANLEELAEKAEQSVETASAINQKNATLVGAGDEPYIIGAAFSMPLNQPSALIKGDNGVYKIEVTQKNIAQDIGNYDNYAKNLRDEANQQLDQIVFEALKSAASIEDNRALYY